MSVHWGGRGPGHSSRWSKAAERVLFDFFADATWDANFAAGEYREAVDGDVFHTPSGLTGWTYSRTGTRTAAYLDGSTADFGANVPAITDKGILVAVADGTSGYDVMPIIALAALESEATVYIEWHNDASPTTGEILFTLNGNAPGFSTKGAIHSGGALDDSADLAAVNMAAFAYDGTDWSRCLNGAPLGLYEDYTVTPVTGKTGVGVGRYHTATAFGQPNVYIRRLAVLPRKISGQGLRVLTTQPDLVLAGVGDSIMKGDAVDEFLPIVAAALGSNVFAPNYGVNGSSWVYDWGSDAHVGTLTDDAVATGGLLDVATPQGHKMVAFAGTNGIVLKGNSAAQEYADFETWLAATLTQGWLASDIVVCTMLPRTGVSEVTRAAYNALLVAGAATHGYRLARFDLDSTIGVSGADLNTTYYSDGTHPTTAGHALLAQIVIAALN